MMKSSIHYPHAGFWPKHLALAFWVCFCSGLESLEHEVLYPFSISMTGRLLYHITSVRLCAME